MPREMHAPFHIEGTNNEAVRCQNRYCTIAGLPQKRPEVGSDEGKISPVSSLQLDSLGNFHLYWQVDHSAKVVTFELKLQLHPSSWFAFGFSDRGNLTGADLCILWVDRKGNHHFEVNFDSIEQSLNSKTNIRKRWIFFGGIRDLHALSSDVGG